MARRALARDQAVGRGADAVVYEEAGLTGASTDPSALPGSPWDDPDERRGRKSGGARGRRWGGSGGRWWTWVGRFVLWALILVILINGIRAPFQRFTANDSGTASAPKAEQGAQFPSSAASAFALQFGNVYLNYNQQTAADRERQLQNFLPDNGGGQFGWNAVGVLQVQSVQVAGVDARDANNAVVTLLARNTNAWFRLAVPVYAKDGAMVISARPALLPPPTRASLPQAGVSERDTSLETELQPTLNAFFRAYAASEQEALHRFSEGPPITGLNKTVTFVQLGDVIAAKGPGDRRTITATVVWQIPAADAKGGGGTLEQTYELTMVKKDTTWNVRDIHGVTRPAGS